jgi:hypothetical protein
MDATNNSFHWKGKDEVGQGKTFYTESMQVVKYSDGSTWDYWTSRESRYALRNMELPHYRSNFKQNFKAHINILLLSNLISAAKVTPNSRTKLR